MPQYANPMHPSGVSFVILLQIASHNSYFFNVVKSGMNTRTTTGGSIVLDGHCSSNEFDRLMDVVSQM